jgi:transposase
MEEVALVGLDLAKNVSQVPGPRSTGAVAFRKQLRCSSLRGIASLPWGSRPAYAKASAKRGKTYAADAEAITEAVTRPTMRLVAVKTKAQQAGPMLHKTRDHLVRQRTMLTDSLG